MSTATVAGMPPRMRAAQKSELRPICFVMPKMPRPSRRASVVVIRAFASTISVSMT
jgi:hypothetical protein